MTTPYSSPFSKKRLSDIRRSQPALSASREPLSDPLGEWLAREAASEHVAYAAPPRPQPVWEPAPLRPSYREAHPVRDFLFEHKTALFRVLVILLAPTLLVLTAFAGVRIRAAVVSQGEQGFDSLNVGLESLMGRNYPASLSSFSAAYASFADAEKNLTIWGETLADVGRIVPGLSSLSSGRQAIEAGKHFAAAGVPLSEIAADLNASNVKYATGERISWLKFLKDVEGPLGQAKNELLAANTALAAIDPNDLPSDKQAKFASIKQKLPVLLGLLQSYDDHEPLVNELLGGNGPRKYLFLLQNNSELRATGGFIGSYALLDVNDGVIRQFSVDGIFNPDGQFKENIVPPAPIQKISAGWSLHDSNWFPDFPTSAEKAINFYEKTGGPTVDGVVALTPTVMQKLLQVTGPIPMPDYGITVDADNFMTVVQEQVEVKYDKEVNQPKKILADLSVLLMQKVFASQDKEALASLASALVDGLNEKQMLIYMRHPQIEALVDEAGWSGRMLDTPKDYLSVVHSNINGYKTDGVIDESIRHQAKIGDDGSIVDTVSITRTHHGGNTPYDWWNKVNADYLRVYVPEGSELISEKGATWEFPEAPLDYDKLGFKRDQEVVALEQGTRVDEKTGTRISEESGKTVFGNWVYVSPQESVTVEYSYRLPFKIDMEAARRGEAQGYSVLFQKQSGSAGSALSASLQYPETLTNVWQTGTDLIPYERTLKFDDSLKTDKFYGAVFGFVSP